MKQAAVLEAVEESGILPAEAALLADRGPALLRALADRQGTTSARVALRLAAAVLEEVGEMIAPRVQTGPASSAPSSSSSSSRGGVLGWILRRVGL